MAIEQCKDCKSEVSTEAKSCPNCGRQNKPLITGLRITLFILAAVFAGLWLRAKQVDEMTATEAADFQRSLQSMRDAPVVDLKDIHEEVASDSVEQYFIAKEQGDVTQICVQAGLVAAAYLQAKNSAEFNRWKSIEKAQCRRAGVPG